MPSGNSRNNGYHFPLDSVPSFLSYSKTCCFNLNRSSFHASGMIPEVVSRTSSHSFVANSPGIEFFPVLILLLSIAKLSRVYHAIYFSSHCVGISKKKTKQPTELTECLHASFLLCFPRIRYFCRVTPLPPKSLLCEFQTSTRHIFLP